MNASRALPHPDDGCGAQRGRRDTLARSWVEGSRRHAAATLGCGYTQCQETATHERRRQRQRAAPTATRSACARHRRLAVAARKRGYAGASTRVTRTYAGSCGGCPAGKGRVGDNSVSLRGDRLRSRPRTVSCGRLKRRNSSRRGGVFVTCSANASRWPSRMAAGVPRRAQKVQRAPSNGPSSHHSAVIAAASVMLSTPGVV